VHQHSDAAGLARSMTKANRVDATHIRAVVTQLEDARGALELMLDEAIARGPLNFEPEDASTIEAFVCELLGTGFLGLTFSLRGGNGRHLPSASELVDMPVGELIETPTSPMPQVYDQATVKVFDTARRPTAVFDDTTNDEYLVMLPRVDVRRSPRLRTSFRGCAQLVARLVTASGRSLSFLQAPVAPPQMADGPRRVMGDCLRFGVAFPRYDQSSRLRFGARLVEACLAAGYGLWQHGRARAAGEDDYWQHVVPPPADIGGAGSAYEAGVGGQGVAITCIGPARPGTTGAILQILERAHAPVGAIGETTLDDIAFVNLVTQTSASAGDVDALPVEASAAIGRALGLKEWPVNSLLEDHRAVVSLRPDRSLPRELYALWVSWSVPGGRAALQLTVRTLRDALVTTSDRYRDRRSDVRRGHLNIEYLVCREVSVDSLRGRMKVAIDLDALDLGGRGREGVSESALGRFCSDVERQWRAELTFALGSPHVDLDVVWRESWVGRWASRPMSSNL
jgi:hypothetical protein